jgi:hypothetical protein
VLTFLRANLLLEVPYVNASKRRVVSIDGNSKNSVEITDHNYADYNNEYNRVA